MSRYRSLETEADNTYVSPFTVGHVLNIAEHDPRYMATPTRPDPPIIPSNFDEFSWYNQPLWSMKRNEPVRSQPPEKIIDRSTVYGPASSGHASLRYYGVGPY